MVTPKRTQKNRRCGTGSFETNIRRGAGGIVTFGAARFPRTEAAYIRAHAGQVLSGGTLPRPIGISDVHERRWLLSCSDRGQVSVMRHDVIHSFHAAEIQKRLILRRFSGRPA